MSFSLPADSTQREAFGCTLNDAGRIAADCAIEAAIDRTLTSHGLGPLGGGGANTADTADADTPPPTPSRSPSSLRTTADASSRRPWKKHATSRLIRRHS